MLAPSQSDNPDPKKYLSETGEYTTPPGASIGTDALTITSGVVATLKFSESVQVNTLDLSEDAEVASMGDPPVGYYQITIRNLGGFNLTFPSEIEWMDQFAYIATADGKDMICFFYDGTSWLAWFMKDFGEA